MLKPGTVLGNYEIVSCVGAGGMGVVYRGRHVKLGHDVALKVLLPNLSQSEKVRVRFQQEAYVQANLKHPSIVRAMDVVEQGETLTIVMDWVDGPSLEEHIGEQGGRLPLHRLWQVMGPVMDAIQFAHERGVVHRDLKPGNILLERVRGIETPKVLDFGIAKILATEGAGLTRPGAVMGTPSYMSPEQLRGETNVDHRSDIYALGAVVHQVATGCLPFEETSDYQTTFRVLSGERPEPASQLVSELPARLDAVIDRAMAFDRDDRYDSVSALQADMKAVVESWTPAAGATGPPPRPSTPRTVLERSAAGMSGIAAPTVFESGLPETPSAWMAAEKHRIPRPRWIVPVVVLGGISLFAVVFIALARSANEDTSAHEVGFTYPNCRRSSDCRTDEECVDERCREAQRPYPYCVSSSDCRRGEICQSNQCEFPPECVQDSDCETHERCSGGSCEPRPYPYCQSASDCRGDEECVDERCREAQRPYPYCVSNSDCRRGEICQSNRCETRIATTPEVVVGEEAPIVVYRARLSYNDHRNSRGAELSGASSVVRQERANFHRYNIRDPEDEYDPMFDDYDRREWLSEAIEDSISPSVERQILNGTPLVEVMVWDDRATVTIISP